MRHKYAKEHVGNGSAPLLGWQFTAASGVTDESYIVIREEAILARQIIRHHNNEDDLLAQKLAFLHPSNQAPALLLPNHLRR